MVTISGDEALAAFRGRLTGAYGLDLVRENGGRVLVQLPVGVGKSVWIDAITREAVGSGAYDLVAVLCPTRQLIDERSPLRDPPPGVRVVNLLPRPARDCGRGRDAQWKRYEEAELGALGRVRICGDCPLRPGCFWPRQYGRGLRGTGILYATQAHLERSPDFLLRVRQWAQAGRMLTLLDESNFVGTSFERVVAVRDLDRFFEVLRRASPSCADPSWRHGAWLALAETLREASTPDLQDRGWVAPFIQGDWAAAVQAAGEDAFPGAFRFLAYALTQFACSPLDSRRRADNGDLQFSVRPWLGDCMVFSGTTDAVFARHRLGQDLASPFADHRFVHPGTRWYNIASSAGTQRYFPGHREQVLDLFAQIVARRAREGKRALLVAKKCFVKACEAGLAERFAGMGLDLRVVTGGWSGEALADPAVVPLINYGAIGTNLFEGFDAAYCLTGYYVNEAVVNACLQDVTRQDLRLPIKVETVGVPRRRRADVAHPDDRYYDTAQLAQPALEFKEHYAVVQAVGRVRPFTRPREVITFQMAELPGAAYDAEFRTLAEARRFFGVPAGGERRRRGRAEEVRSLRAGGLTQAEVARRLGVSERTVRRDERRTTGQNVSPSTSKYHLSGSRPAAGANGPPDPAGEAAVGAGDEPGEP
jgi:hypothetical protein